MSRQRFVREEKAVALVGGLALLGAIPYVSTNQVRPFIRVSYSDNRNADEGQSILSATRERLYFADPMLALLRAGLEGPTVRYVGVENRSSVYKPSIPSVPCVVVCLGCAFVRQKWDQYAGPNTSILQFDRVVVFLRPRFETIPMYTQAADADALRAVGLTETLLVDSRKPTKNGICQRLPDEVATGTRSWSGRRVR